MSLSGRRNLMAGIVPGWPAVKVRILRNGSAVYVSKGAYCFPHLAVVGELSIIKSGVVCKPVDVFGVDPVGSLPVASASRLATWCRGPRLANSDRHE